MRKVIVDNSTNQGRSHSQSSEVKKNKPTKAVSTGWWTLATQIALGTLGIAVVIGGALLGWHYQHVRSNVAWLDKHGADFQWHYQVPHLGRLDWQKVQSKLAPVVGQAVVSDIHTVSLTQPTLSDEDLMGLSKLSTLHQLSLSTDAATDDTLARVARLKQLRSVSLSGDRFTFEGLLALRKLPRLRTINLHDMRLSAAELAVLESAVPMANLKYNRDGMPRPYERTIIGRYAKVQKDEPLAEVGFEPLIKMGRTNVDGMPVSTVAEEPETVHAS